VKIPYLIYTHSEYLDVLKISADYFKNINNKILITDSSNIATQTDYKALGFNRVLFYDDNLPYAEKLFKVFTELDFKYVLFTHEIDVLLSRDESILDKLVQWMEHKNVDRVELQINNSGGNTGDYIEILPDKNVSNWIEVRETALDSNKQYLHEHSIPGTYRYNVNPSIWKFSSFRDLLHNLSYKTYRQIESQETEEFCKKFKIYSLYTPTPLQCGYFKCVPFYKFFHITHRGEFVKLNDTLTTRYGQSYNDATADYKNIIDRHNLFCGKRTFA
jgi:hypothetical protein